jgi:hypothetical protein
MFEELTRTAISGTEHCGEVLGEEMMQQDSHMAKRQHDLCEVRMGWTDGRPSWRRFGSRRTAWLGAFFGRPVRGSRRWACVRGGISACNIFNIAR